MPIPRKSRRSDKSSFKDGLEFTSGLIHVAAKACNSATQDPFLKDLVTRLDGQVRSKSWAKAVASADELSVLSYQSPEEHLLFNQLASLVRKVPFQDPLLTPAQLAWDKFLAAEQKCKDTNDRFLSLTPDHYVSHEYLERCRAWILKVIGESPDLSSIFERCEFGPGASYGVHGECTHVGAKLSAERWTVTGSAFDYARACMMGDHHVWEYLLGSGDRPFCMDPVEFRNRFAQKADIVATNKITMVPKTAKVHRTIAIEPLLNGYIQTGVDLYLKDCLKRYGFDLTDQTRNRRLAYSGSMGGFDPLVTLDLSAASDSVSIQLVRYLLPPDWFEFLNAIRSPAYESEYGSGRYEKFVSMGNGFCFPLETLIFGSLVVSVYDDVYTPDRVYAVYGDDIIVHQSTALLLTERLSFCGFSINNDKSFYFGPFRESCGADYFEGVPVRPYTLKDIPKTYRDIFKVMNRLSAVYSKPGWISLLWDFCLSKIPDRMRYFRPTEGPDDTAINVPIDVFMTSRYARWSKVLQGWTWREYITKPVLDDKRYSASVAVYGMLRGCRSHDGQVAFALRRKTRTGIRMVPDTSMYPSNRVRALTR